MAKPKWDGDFGYDSCDETPRAWCPCCGAMKQYVIRDFGIGGYEFWGCKGHHVELATVCPDCESEYDPHRCPDSPPESDSE